MLVGESTHGANFGTNGKPVQCFSNDAQIAKKYELLVQNHNENKKIGFFDKSVCIGEIFDGYFRRFKHRRPTLRDTFSESFEKIRQKLREQRFFFRFPKTNFSGHNFRSISTDLTSENPARFSLSNDTLHFQKYEFFAKI